MSAFCAPELLAALRPGVVRALSAQVGVADGYINKARQVIERGRAAGHVEDDPDLMQSLLIQFTGAGECSVRPPAAATLPLPLQRDP